MWMDCGNHKMKEPFPFDLLSHVFTACSDLTGWYLFKGSSSFNLSNCSQFVFGTNTFQFYLIPNQYTFSEGRIGSESNYTFWEPAEVLSLGSGSLSWACGSWEKSCASGQDFYTELDYWGLWGNLKDVIQENLSPLTLVVYPWCFQNSSQLRSACVWTSLLIGYISWEHGSQQSHFNICTESCFQGLVSCALEIRSKVSFHFCGNRVALRAIWTTAGNFKKGIMLQRKIKVWEHKTHDFSLVIRHCRTQIGICPVQNVIWLICVQINGTNTGISC